MYAILVQISRVHIQLMIIRFCVLLLTTACVYAVDSVRTVTYMQIDSGKVAASGLGISDKKDMPDFTVTYLAGPKDGDLIGIYHGGHPTAFSTSKKVLGEVKGMISGLPVIWTIWSDASGNTVQYGAETIFDAGKVICDVKPHYSEYRIVFHLFVFRASLQDLYFGRCIASSLIMAGPDKRPQN